LRAADADSKQFPRKFGAMVIVLNNALENDQYRRTGATICAAYGKDMINGAC